MRWWRAGAVALGLLAVAAPAAAQAAVGTVSGTVKPLEWAPEVEVCLVEGRPSETCTTPGADGSYTLEVPLGEIQIEFIPSIRSRLLTQYYDHQSLLKDAARIKLTRENPEAKEIDADLIEGGAIAGTVSAAAGGSPLVDVEVCALSLSASPALKRCEETDASGAYEIHSLPAGSYTVVFRGRGKSAEYEPSYFDGKQAPAQATPVVVNTGVTSTGIDAALEKGAKIEGVVTKAGGGSLSGIDICLFASTAVSPGRCTYSDASGSYSFEGLPSGAYQVGFSLEPGEIGGEGENGEGDGFESQYFDGVSSRAQAATISASAPSPVSGVDATLSRPPAPPVPIPPPAVSTPILAAAAFVPEPAPAAKRCKEGFRKRRVKGKTRCVKARKAGRGQAHHGKRKGKGR